MLPTQVCTFPYDSDGFNQVISRPIKPAVNFASLFPFVFLPSSKTVRRDNLCCVRSVRAASLSFRFPPPPFVSLLTAVLACCVCLLCLALFLLLSCVLSSICLKSILQHQCRQDLLELSNHPKRKNILKERKKGPERRLRFALSATQLLVVLPTRSECNALEHSVTHPTTLVQIEIIALAVRETDRFRANGKNLTWVSSYGTSTTTVVLDTNERAKPRSSRWWRGPWH